MANKLFNQLNKNSGNNNFIEFMSANKGKDPNQMLNELINSGKISQEQLNHVQNYANKNIGKFNAFKAMFGF